MKSIDLSTFEMAATHHAMDRHVLRHHFDIFLLRFYFYALVWRRM